MRRLLVLPAVLLAAAGFVASGDEAPRDPQLANIVGACSPSENGAVQPPVIRMRRIDNVVWRSASPNVASWVITPKEAGDWPFAAAFHAGNQQAGADSGLPTEGAEAERAYRYNVTITCANGSTEVIDPEIIIGDG